MEFLENTPCPQASRVSIYISVKSLSFLIYIPNIMLLRVRVPNIKMVRILTELQEKTYEKRIEL